MSCPRRLRGGAACVVIATTVLAVVAPFGAVATAPATAQSLDDLDDARDVVDGVRSELEAVTDRYERVWADIERARQEIAGLRNEALALEVTAQDANRALGDRAITAFKHGTTATMQTLLASDGPQETVERAGLLAALQVREQIRIEEADATRLALDQTVQLIADREGQLAQRQAELERLAAELQDELVTAREGARQIESLVARQRRIDRGSQSGIYSCIFDPGVFTFRDTFGAPRSGGRSHRGTDVFAPDRVAVFAITPGVIERHSNSALGGLGLYLRGDDGNLYYYAHLDRIVADGRVGNRVTAGQQVALNGHSGNADAWAPHVHFELHPGGGNAINPYPWLAAACF